MKPDPRLMLLALALALAGCGETKQAPTGGTAGGEVNLESLTQSETKPLSQGEGLLDAFDVGAI